MNSYFLLRIKDVLLCLLHAKKYECLLGRLEIQKIIYLVDSVSAYLFVLSGKKGHQTYFYGPYDKNIQNALDALVIRDLAEMCDIKVTNTVSCNYIITNTGECWVDNLIKSSSSIKQRVRIYDGIIYSLVERNKIHKVKDLVYAEPLYVTSKDYGNHYNLDLEHENSGHNYLALIEHYLRNSEEQPDIRFVADLYIDYLSSRDQILSGNAFVGGD